MFGLELRRCRWFIYRRSLYPAFNPNISLFRYHDLHASISSPPYYHIHLYQLNYSTELRSALVLLPILGTDKISPSYPKIYSSRMERFIINLRFWTRTSELILSSLLKQYVTSFFVYIYWQVAKGLPWFASSQIISNIGFNMSIGATIMHVLLWYGKDIIKNIKRYRVSPFFFLLRAWQKQMTDWNNLSYT